MKKLVSACVLGGAVLLSGCQAPYSGGFIYNNYNAPVDVRDNTTACDKRGESSMVNILGYFAVGDAGVEAAKANGGVTKVGNVDVNFQSLLGIFGKTTTVVCGE
jgi:hypothetical protein